MTSRLGTEKPLTFFLQCTALAERKLRPFPGSHFVLFFMYLRAIFCTFQISVDFAMYLWVGEEGGEGGLEKERGLERGG